MTPARDLMHGIFFEPSLSSNGIHHVLKEIYIDGVYDQFFEGKKDWVVVDIGAHVGLFSYYASPYSRVVYAVEPSLQHFNAFNFMLGFNKITNVNVLNVAIDKESGEKKLWHTGNRTAFNIHPSTEQGLIQSTGKADFEMVKTITIEELFENLKIEHCDFLKLDIEGVEHDVLQGIPFSKVASKVERIVLEIHPWAGRHPHQLIETLKNNGFKPFVIPNQTNLLGGTK